VAQGKGHEDEVAAALQEGGVVTADRLHKNVKVWSLYLDLEESLGSVESCRAAYDRVIEIKVHFVLAHYPGIIPFFIVLQAIN